MQIPCVAGVVLFINGVLGEDPLVVGVVLYINGVLGEDPLVAGVVLYINGVLGEDPLVAGEERGEALVRTQGQAHEDQGKGTGRGPIRRYLRLTLCKLFFFIGFMHLHS